MNHLFIRLRHWVGRLTGGTAPERPALAQESADAVRPAAMRIELLEERVAPGIVWGD